jgi:hypothetical protein
VSDERGKKGGTVLGNTTSATMPSSSRSWRRRSLFQLRSASGPLRSTNGLTNASAHASNSSW